MKNIAVFASGSGTNFEALINAVEVGYINAEIKLVVCDKKNAFVLERAKNHKVPAFVFTLKDYESKEAYESAIVELLKENNIDLILLAGYMKICGSVLLAEYEGRIVNIHPALLPAFKGAHAIKDAYDYGVKVFGVTIHYIDKDIDCGTIIAQKAFECEDDDTLEDIERKIHLIEHDLYPATVKKIIEEN
jgi:phosphoribosylglycinamide formyltransferase-1